MIYLQHGLSLKRRNFFFKIRDSDKGSDFLKKKKLNGKNNEEEVRDPSVQRRVCDPLKIVDMQT